MTLDYKLALSLKDAGFPQKYGEVHRFIYPDGSREMVLTDEEAQVRDAAFIPTLSELIEECEKSPKGESDGRQSFFLQGFYIPTRDQLLRRWRAGYHAVEPYMMEDFSTPEEAVAELWLALNEKPLPVIS